MSSTDYASSSQEASDIASDDVLDSVSDEVYINTCSPCSHRGSQKKATQYCLDCHELLCLPCKEAHQSFKQSRQHNFSGVATDRRVLLDAKVIKSSKANVRLPSDKRCPQITGCAFLPNGNVVLCDRHNNNLKLLDLSYAVRESLDFPSHPRDVSVIDRQTIVIILPDHKSLQYVDVEPKLRPGRAILLRKMPLAVESVDDEIFVACKEKDKSGTGEILIIDSDGNLKRRIGAKPDRSDFSCLFDCPTSFTVSKTTKKIFVSDRETSIVTCLSPSESIVYKYKSPDLTRTRGLYVDAVDNILVCGESSTNVQILTPAGKQRQIILSARDIVRQPCSVAYREKDNTLLIGCYNHEYILMFTTN